MKSINEPEGSKLHPGNPGHPNETQHVPDGELQPGVTDPGPQPTAPHDPGPNPPVPDGGG